ncbi:MAG: 4-hydroxy-tetrahydrodipicolinate synthase [Myxococcales bacterium]|nr:4-hydroxy-tetrahydrodipicolinate synthase [Myxococcales bacterium]
MSKKPENLSGTFTALVTPFKSDGSVDYGALEALVNDQLENGIDGLVPCGTTGESATMTAQERQDVITFVVDKAAGRVPVVAGAGSNNTAVAIEHQKRALDTGAQYALVVTPYYNKPTPEGLYQHYCALLEAADIPIILYNVPGRTGCDMLPETIGRLAKLDGVVAVKEATADLDRVAAIQELSGGNIALLSGDDGTACPFALLGGDGVISVVSNVLPKQTSDMMRAALSGEVESAREIHNSLRGLIDALFIESNPIPVKAALALRGLISENYRLPLCQMATETRATLENIMRQDGWL